MNESNSHTAKPTFSLINCFSQKDMTIKYQDFVKSTDSVIELASTRFLKVDNQISNSRNKTVGYGTDYFHWISDTIYLIKSTEDYKLKNTGYSIYFKNNKPIFYQKDRRWISKDNSNSKKIYFIDNLNNRIYSLNGKKELNSKDTELIFNRIDYQFDYWIESLKDFSFEKLHTPNKSYNP